MPPFYSSLWFFGFISSLTCFVLNYVSELYPNSSFLRFSSHQINYFLRHICSYPEEGGGVRKPSQRLLGSSGEVPGGSKGVAEKGALKELLRNSREVAGSL
jgi:hypothetical protein